MGLGGAADLLDGGGGKASLSVWCSICLDVVMDNGDRSWAKLQCGHQFHLDCIGSAFNTKGAMQCPNCRKIEKGQWLYANGSRPVPEFSMDDLAHDEDLYDLSYSEMSFGVHWCPFSGLTRFPSSFDEGEFSSNAYHDLLGHHAIFAEHGPVSSTSHHCPYVAYFGPIHPSSSTSSGSVSDGSSFNNNHWSGPSVPSEVRSSYAFPSMDAHYHSWDNSSPFAAGSHIGADQPSIPSVTQRTARNTSDIHRHGMHPFVIGRSSGGRASSSVTSSVLPPYVGAIGRPRDRPQSLQSYFQQSISGPAAARAPPLASTARRPSSHRSLAQVGPVASSSDQSSGFYLFSSSGRSSQEAENPLSGRFHVWGRERQPWTRNDFDSIWGPFHPPSDNRSTGNHQRHGSERMPSHNRS
ncbi:hypothetical protein BUALT_Bualt01G0140200 [Buddleja alternifolia]|uniref:RING-type domain-containing protein n=1 Tax=Buddleja alternifolia TaxID=168488 RepID=A0AAV6YB46_9LAMI|nr:hypothetical protein BUALT_Bualt01G0140200 [Buddleja alternifolia]